VLEIGKSHLSSHDQDYIPSQKIYQRPYYLLETNHWFIIPCDGWKKPRSLVGCIIAWLTKDIILVTYPTCRQRISDYINKVYEWAEDSKAIVQTVEVPEGTGTGDALRAIKGKIKVIMILKTT
jgi:hypothetical protein